MRPAARGVSLKELTGNMQLKPRVLLVEDRSDLAAMYQLAFDIAGFDIRVAVTGTEGVTIAESGWPQLMVLDMQLPDLDGFARSGVCSARALAMPGYSL